SRAQITSAHRTHCDVRPRRDHVAVGRSRTRTRTYRPGKPARERPQPRPFDDPSALMEIPPGNPLQGPRRRVARGRGTGGSRPGTADAVLAHPRRTLIRGGRAVVSMTERSETSACVDGPRRFG